MNKSDTELIKGLRRFAQAKEPLCECNFVYVTCKKEKKLAGEAADRLEKLLPPHKQ